jgi:hypothetical protein
MRSSRRLAIALVLGASLVAAPSGGAATEGSGAARAGGPAVGDGADWLLSLTAQTDEESYRNLLADFHLGLTADLWLTLTAGASRAPVADLDIRASLAAAGVEYDFGPLGLGLLAERWGDSGNLETRDWRGELFFDGDRYRLELAYEQRSIDIYFSGGPRLTDLRRVGVDATGIGLSGYLRPSPDWRIYGSWMDYDFPRGVRVVPRADRLNLLSVSTVTLAYGLEDRSASFGVERTLGRMLLDIDLGHDRSAIDGAVLRSISAALLWPVARRLDIELTLGRSRTAGFGSSLYGGLSFLIYGK